MKVLFTLLLAAFALKATAQADRKDRIIASYLIAMGNLPTQGEINHWMTDPLSNRSVNELVAKHRQNMQTMGNMEAVMIQNAYMTVFGRYPRPDETEYWRQDNKIYVELVEQHKRYLGQYSNDRREMIRLSYLQGMNREPRKEEIDYWMAQPVMTCADIKVHHFRNRKNEPAHNRIDNSSMFSVQPAVLTTKVRSEMKATLSGVNASSLVASGMNCISVGGGNVISTGEGNVISTGGGNVISTGGLN